MKILRVYVENFGVLRSYSKDFDASFECIFRDNGSGKTTLAAFISAMFYGMDTTRKADKTLKDRARYLPWQGGRYGGSIEVEKDKTVYRIERTFDKTSQSGDSLTVYNLSAGMRPEDLGISPGETLLGMSKEAFYRTVFLSKLDLGTPNDLLPKLNKNINGTEESDAYQQAMLHIERARKTLKADKGDKGKIYDIEKEIEALDRERNHCEIAVQTAEELEKNLQGMKKELKETEEKLQMFHDYEKDLLIRENLKNYETKLDNAEEDLKNFYLENGTKRANAQTVETCKQLLNSLRKASDVLSEKAINQEDAENFAHLDELFKEQPLSLEDIDNAGRTIGAVTDSQKTVAECANFECGDEYSDLEDRFHGSVPTEQEVEQLEFLCADYVNFEKSHKERTGSMASGKRGIQSPSVLTWVVFAFGFLSLLCGAALTPAELPLGVSALAAGAVLLTVSFVLYFFKDRSGSHHLGAKNEEKEREFLNLKKSIEEKLALYRYDAENIPASVKKLSEDRKSYLKMRAGIDANRQREEAARKRAREGLLTLRQFFEKYFDLTENFSIYDCDGYLKSLRTEYLRYTQFEAILQRENSKKRVAKDELEDYLRAMRELLSPYGYTFDASGAGLSLEKEERLIGEEQLLKNEVEKRKKEKEEYRLKNPVNHAFSNAFLAQNNREALTKRQKELVDAIASQTKRLEYENSVAEHLEECEIRLASLKETRGDVIRKLSVLRLTGEYLEKAEARLVARYTDPIKNKYVEYAAQVNVDLCKGLYILPEDLSPCFEREGEIRKNENFSSGFCALSDIFLRLAILEAAYPENMPFLILDDPFVYLDDENEKKTMEVLRRLSFRTQIIYFTCHSSRNVSGDSASGRT